MPGLVDKQFTKRRQNFRSTSKSYPELPYSYKRILHFSRVSPKLRQYRVRNDIARVSPGLVGLSNAMKASYIRIFKMFDKEIIRKALIDIVPIIAYRLEDNRRHLFDNKSAEEMLPKDAPGTLNEVKKQMFEKREDFDAMNKQVRFLDGESQARLRRNIKQKIMRFHRKADFFNSMEKRNVSPDPKDSTAYHLFRAAGMYAAVYRVFHELSKMMPFFIPRSVLDFGTGTGVALLALKEIYDPDSMIRKSPGMAHLRHTFFHNVNHKKFTYGAFCETLNRNQADRLEQKKKRYMAVIGLLHRGDILLDDIPSDLRHEIIDVGMRAIKDAQEKMTNQKSSADTQHTWTDDKFQAFKIDLEELKQSVADNASEEYVARSHRQGSVHSNDESSEKSWWEKLVESQNTERLKSVSSRLKPLQSVIGIEPSQGMIEIAMVNLAEELPKVFWRNSLSSNEPDAVSDLVVAAYTFSEIATIEARRDALLNLWAHTGKVLVVIDHGNVPGFSIMMEIRSLILELKNCGSWENQPTIVGPCPHEQRCPVQHSCAGNKYPNLRVCNSSVAYELTFIEKWIYRTFEKKGKEHFTYLIVARNESVPQRNASKKVPISKNVANKQFDDENDSATLTNIRHSRGADHVEKFKNKHDVPDGLWNPLPVPAHVYNRALSWDSVKNHDAVLSSNKALTIHNEVDEYEKFYLERLHNFYRVTSEPHKKGYANFCKPNGDLVRARIKKHFSGSKGSVTFRRRYATYANWQHIGGYSLLMRSTKGGLIPANIPLSREKKFEQQNKPNTFVDDTEKTPLEKTSMLLGTESDGSRASDEKIPGVSISHEIVQNARDVFLQGESPATESDNLPLKNKSADAWKRKIQSTRRSLREKMKLRHVHAGTKNLKDPKKPQYIP